MTFVVIICMHADAVIGRWLGASYRLPFLYTRDMRVAVHSSGIHPLSYASPTCQYTTTPSNRIAFFHSLPCLPP